MPARALAGITLAERTKQKLEFQVFEGLINTL